MSLYEAIKDEVAAYIGDVKARLTDGFSFADVWPLVSAATLRLTRIAQETGASGPEKKEAVLAALEQFYDEVVTPLDLPGVPNLIIEGIVDNAIKALIRPMLGPLIDRVVAEQKAWGAL